MESSRSSDGYTSVKRKVFAINVVILLLVGAVMIVDGLSRIIIEQDKMRAADPFVEVVFGLAFMGLGLLFNKWRNALSR